jgi:transcriptional regulator with XRE-family HTH domain
MHGVHGARQVVFGRLTLDSVVRAVRELRQHFGESQQAFANRLGLSIRAIANYEKDRRPTGMALVSLARAALVAGKRDLTNTFMTALMNELEMGDIPFRWMALSRRGERMYGQILANLDDKESIEYATAFWDTLEAFNSDFPDVKARARQILGEFKAAADRESGPIPEWALQAEARAKAKHAEKGTGPERAQRLKEEK